MPVLQDGDDPPLWETGAILRYLAGRYGSDRFWPSDPAARAQVDKWAEWAKLNIALNFTTPVFWRVVRTAPENRDPPAIARAIAEFETGLKIAESRLARRPFLASDDLTLADIQFGHVLYRYYDIDIPRADLPAVAAYYARLAERPAFREHCDAVIRGFTCGLNRLITPTTPIIPLFHQDHSRETTASEA